MAGGAKITLDMKVFVGLLTALLGAGGYATVSSCPKDTGTNAPLAARMELMDTAQAWKNRYMMDSISRVGRNVDIINAKLDTMTARQDRYLALMLGAARQNAGFNLSSCHTKNPTYTMRAP